MAKVSNTALARATVATGLGGGTGGPLFVTAPPGDKSRIFIVGQGGLIRQLARGAAPTAWTVFLDISARLTHAGDEQGLLGLAFDPNFATNGFFYVYYTRLSDGNDMLSRFRTLDGTPNTVGDPASETVLYRIVDTEDNHNGGWLSFGPDGFLYIGEGDGGGGGDQHGTCGNGQNTSTMLGKILRIDPNGIAGNPPDCGLDAGPYTIPASNPLADGHGGNCDEIFAYGLRNPWRNSFDASNGDIYVADVGQGCWEEVDWIPVGTSGQNFGWRNFEGSHCYNPSQGCSATSSAADGCAPACNDPAPSGDPIPNGTHLPIYNYSSSVNPQCAITGGYVYRGCRMTNFQGKYFYGDYCAGIVQSFIPGSGVPNTFETWAGISSGMSNSLTSFGTDAQGEIYFCDRKGTVYMILPPLTDVEVSGEGAADQLRLDKSGAWTWEDINFTSRQLTTSYHVYRANVADDVFNAGEVFDCVFQTTGTTWPAGGDPASPAPNSFFAYVVTALNGATQSSPGGTPVRTLGAASCP
ncbi:MAG TPA: PQQ-dependent sugar dehydrogenase [Candidatus Polarisedimenticolaceae bacterium]|nr:PQQ-dependent sugar dehydrogenase [Candidatus Polarisedimenticolaceae bacterium]